MRGTTTTTTTATTTTSAIRFRGVSKRFAGVTALTDVSFDVAAGTCHAICGENGAGKSTLGRILAGIERPDAGSVELFGIAVKFASPRDALDGGIAMVHQELAFCPNLTVGENLCLASLPRRGAFVDGAATVARARAMLAAIDSPIDPARTMSTLSVAEQQIVQIAVAVGANARVIVFDEPTSSLGAREAERLYAVIDALKAAGTTVLFVSHRMPEIFRLCDTVTVLRDGTHVATKPVSEVDEAALVQLMIGRALVRAMHAHVEAAPGAVALDVRGLSCAGRVHDVSFGLRSGEVVGLAGLVGAGRSEVAQALFGLDPTATGRVTVRGKPLAMRSTHDAMERGIGYVPEDRKRQGLVLSMRNRENASLAVLERFATRGWVSAAREREAVTAALGKAKVTASAEVATATLSGGNQQKVVLAKWLAAGSGILILDEPTRGVDVGAKAELHEWIARAVAGGAAVLLISSDMPELLDLSTRVVVMRDGHVVGEFARADATQDRVLRLMSGLQDAA